MDSILDIILYTLIFLSLYVQVFFLFTFFEKRRKLKISNNEVIIDSYPTIGIIVPCWNEEETIEGTIDSIRLVNYPKDKLKIYIIDDGSTDNTWNIIKKFENDPNIKVFHKENGGKHTAMNYALQYVDTDLVSSFDADTILEKNALLEMVKFFECNKDVSAIGGTILIDQPKALSQKAQSIEYQMFSFNKKMLGLIGGVLVAPGAFSIYKREVLQSVGGWRLGHLLEDLELTFRIQKNGFVVDHCHTAIAYTKGPNTVKRLFKQRIRWGTGFLNNIKEYNKLILNKDFGNFGIFTIPMSILAYISLVFVFSYSWYRMGYLIYDQIKAFKILGLSYFSINVFSWDWFFVDVKSASFLSMILFSTIISSIFLGRRLSGVKSNFLYIIWYFLLYSFLQPLWIIRSIIGVTFYKKESWR